MTQAQRKKTVDGAFASAGSGLGGEAARPDTGRRRLLRRLAYDRSMLGRACRRLAGVLDPACERETELRDATDPLFEACRLVGRAQGIDFAVPHRAGHLSDLPELAAANRVRHRKVLLRDDWWRRDNGPLLAFRPGEDDAEGRPVALLPAAPGRYELVDPVDGRRRKVDRKVAAEEGLAVEAYMFYTPLPERPLTLLDLLRAGLRGLRRDAVTFLAVSLTGGILALLTPLLVGRIVGSAIPNTDRVELVHMTLALILGAVSAALFQLGRGLTLLRLKSKIDGSLQAALWDRLLTLPVPFFRRFTAGDLESRAMGISQVQELLTGHVTVSILSLVSALFSLAILFYYSWWLALGAVAMVVLLAVLTAAVAIRQLHHQRALQRIGGKLAGLLYAFISGVAKLRAGGAEQRAYAVWAERFAEQRRHTVAVQRLTNVQAVVGTVYGLTTSLLIFAMVGLSTRWVIGVGDYVAFNVAFAQFQAAALAAIAVISTVLGFVPTWERMTPILKAVPEVAQHQPAAGPLQGTIELHGLSFRYREDGDLVLDDVSLTAHPGEFVALVGPSGSGKSTCLRLALGFEKPLAGSVLYDGQNLTSLDIHSVRRQLGVVLQNSRPLVGDIFHNIVGSRPLTIDDAWRAARAVGLEEEIRDMPMSMFTHVNHRGVSFSGGQRQRLLIARALVDRPRMLLLDEATSSLDNRSQEIVMKSLGETSATRIVIAHRLSTIKNADRIYVLDRGRMVAEGTFEELVRAGGLFQRMIERQLA